jgi:hypothetical protein
MNPVEDLTFNVGVYKVSRISKLGLWLVTTDSLFDLGCLFWRAQEFYESPNPEFAGKSFALLDFMRWYCTEQSETHDFSYFTDFEGYNLPDTAIEAALASGCPDPNKYDVLFGRIVAEIRALQGGPYYVIGARTGDQAVTEHEIAHGMFYLLPKYREQASKLVNALPQRDEIFKVLEGEGYGEICRVDEAQAYLATGLFQELLHLEPIRHPFMKLYASHRKKLIKPTKELK